MQGGLSTVIADLVWGLAADGIDNTPNVQGDPAAEPVDNILTYQVEQPGQLLDFGTVETQLMIRDILGTLFADIDAGIPLDERRGVVSFIARNPLNAVREFCVPGSTTDTPEEDRPPRNNLPECQNIDDATRLPTGKDFHAAAFMFIATSPEGVRPPLLLLPAAPFAMAAGRLGGRGWVFRCSRRQAATPLECT